LSFWSRCCCMLFFAIVCIAYQPFVFFCLDLVEWSAFW
jgi:hypothetical protein